MAKKKKSTSIHKVNPVIIREVNEEEEVIKNHYVPMIEENTSKSEPDTEPVEEEVFLVEEPVVEVIEVEVPSQVEVAIEEIKEEPVVEIVDTIKESLEEEIIKVEEKPKTPKKVKPKKESKPKAKKKEMELEELAIAILGEEKAFDILSNTASVEQEEGPFDDYLDHIPQSHFDYWKKNYEEHNAQIKPSEEPELIQDHDINIFNINEEDIANGIVEIDVLPEDFKIVINSDIDISIVHRFIEISKSPFELRYKTAKIYDSRTSKCEISFNENHVAVNGKKYPYSNLRIINK